MRRFLTLVLAAGAGAALTAAALVGPARTALTDSDHHLDAFERCMDRHGFDVSGDVVVRVTQDGVTINGEAVDPD